MPGEAMSGVSDADSLKKGVTVGHKKGSPAEEAKQALIVASGPLPLRSYASLRSLIGCALDGFEWVINFLASEPEHNFFLSGNFAPVPEPAGVSKGLQLTGKLPVRLLAPSHWEAASKSPCSVVMQKESTPKILSRCRHGQ